jgi:hypothetical protein
MARVEGGGWRVEAPWPLLTGFGVFLVAIGYLMAASFTRRAAPTFAPTVGERTRAADWERVGDVLTVDATDGKQWRYVSLETGRVSTAPDTAGWAFAVRRYNLRVNGEAFDTGETDFETLGTTRGETRAALRVGPPRDRGDVGKWYRYSLLTHLLESNWHVYVVPSKAGRPFKMQIVSYYCPGLKAGCMTVRYAPLLPARESSDP